MDKVIGKNFKDDQYRYSVHLVVVLVTATLVIALGQIYESTATIAVLVFGYLGVLLSTASRLFKAK